MENLIGITKQELSQKLNEFEPYRVNQIWNWIYCHGKKSFDDMDNISKKFKLKLKEKYILERPKILKHLFSRDGTQKWLIEFEKETNKNTVEMVYIPSDDRGTLCISSQIGCAMGCKFCVTGKQGFIRNLTATEIVQQVIIVRDELKEWENLNKKIGGGRAISNIVFMGMGEPLLNRKNVEKSINIINAPDGIAFSNRRITLSTCGIVPEIKKLNLKVNLAISLHAPNDEIRKKIMPIAEKYSIKEIIDVCIEYTKKNSDRRVTIEYILIDGVNDSEKNAIELVKLFKKYDLPVKFNLIPFNEWSGCDFKTSKNSSKFAKILTDAKYPSPIRKSMGQDIMAACGQLKEISLK